MIFSLLTIKCSKWIYWNQLGRASRPSVRLLWTATSDSYRNGDASIQYHDDQHFYSILSVCDMSRNFIRPRGWHDVRILKIYYQSTQLLRTKANRFFPSVAAVSTHFSKYRASALGLVTAGSCLGMWPLQHLPHAKNLWLIHQAVSSTRSSFNVFFQGLASHGVSGYWGSLRCFAVVFPFLRSKVDSRPHGDLDRGWIQKPSETLDSLFWPPAASWSH